MSQPSEPSAANGRIILSLGNAKKGCECCGSGTDTDEVVDARGARTTERKGCGRMEEEEKEDSEALIAPRNLSPRRTSR